MCSLACRPLALLLASLTLSAAAWAQAPRPSIEDFPRADRAQALVATGLVPPAIPPVWDNGPPDDATAHAAQNAGAPGFFKVADDILIKDAEHLFIHEIEVCFLVSVSIDGVMCKPDVALNIHDDCDARPHNVITSVSDPDRITAINDGPSATFPGFNEWRFIFRVEQAFEGYQRLWIAPFGIAELGADMESCQGYYFWRSANNGTIQGAQGQLATLPVIPRNGSAEVWSDVQDCGCPDYCTDFCFTVRGHRCCLVADNTPFTTIGSSSIQLKGALIPTARTVDNFQIGPHAPARLCAVEAWMATNCNTDKIFLEIYDNECDSPVGITPIHVIDDGDVLDPDLPDFPIAQDTGVDHAGCNVYRLFWPDIQGIVLEPGKNYWLSVVARANGGINDKAQWMQLGVFTCNRHITEGQVRDPFVEGLEDFTPISVASQLKGSSERDLAFRLWIDAAAPPRLGACCLAPPACTDDATQDQCNDLGGAFFADTQCNSSPCPPPPGGACCLPSGTCTEPVTISACDSLGGTYILNGTCATAMCAPPIGACCTAAACVDNLSEADCTAVGLAWFEAQSCSIATCVDYILGACCNESTGACTDLALTGCASVSGAQWTDGQLCATITCGPPPPPVGACCFSTGACADDTIESDCLGILAGSAWTASQACTAIVCEPIGACCNEFTGTCTDNTSATECQVLTGTFFPAVACSGISCELTGACCEETVGVCTSTSDLECAVILGTFHPLLSCSDIPCDLVGACCDQSVGVCFDDTGQSNCDAIMGTFYLLASCSEVLCEPLGACCDEVTGICTDNITEPECSAFAGTFTVNTPCAAVTCDQLGACCDETVGICTDNITEPECSAFAGTFYPAQSCGSITCSQPGACCFSNVDARGGSCIDTTEEGCTTAGGQFFPAIDCTAAACSPPTTIPPGGGGSNGGPSTDAPTSSSAPIDRTSQIND